MTSIEEDEEDCDDTNEIGKPYSTANQVRSDASFGGSETCTFYDADVGDEMRAKVNAFSKLYDISITKAKRQKAITDVFVHNEHKL